MIHPELLERLKVITEEEQKIIEGEISIDRSIYMENAGDVISSKKLVNAGKLIAVRPHTRFVHFPVHSHDFVEIIYMCSGSTTHIVDGDRIELREGELLFLCQSAKQEILPAGYDDIAVNFLILPEFFDSALEMMGEEDTPLRRFVVECLKNNRANAGYLHFEVSGVLPIQNLLENLIWTLIHGTPNKRNINQITMGLLFLQLINHTDKLVSQHKEEQTIVKVLRYIEENYKSGSLAELTEILHYDASALSREIKSSTGKNYIDLVQEKRMSQSCFLLKNTDMTIWEIAEKVGYENISFFYRLFKKHYGISPKKYRSAESSNS